jgi:hypothetical protein
MAAPEKLEERGKVVGLVDLRKRCLMLVRDEPLRVIRTPPCPYSSIRSGE